MVLTAGEAFQTWNLSKNLHSRILRLKILHRQFHLISTFLVGKNTKVSENGEIYSAGKKFTLPPALTAWTNSTSGEVFLRNGQISGQHFLIAWIEVRVMWGIFSNLNNRVELRETS